MQISIHALREEGDRTRAAIRCAVAYFYPRPPRGGRLERVKGEEPVFGISIHALREEGDSKKWGIQDQGADFYPRPPRGGRHAARAEYIARMEFLSTPSARRATSVITLVLPHITISIHALREEGDRRRGQLHNHQRNFYPRPPRGGRRQSHKSKTVRPVFLSTPSARRATLGLHLCFNGIRISIHALREEGDNADLIGGKGQGDFYPRPPRGGRQGGHNAGVAGRHISIHALREEGDMLT